MEAIEQIVSNKNDVMAGQSIIETECFTKSGLAREINKSERTLDRWHALRFGPPRIQLGKTILYPRAGFLEWLRGLGDSARNGGGRNGRRGTRRGSR
jgi:hypothetical protein